MKKFPLGQLVATPNALEALQDSKQSPIQFITRHATGDWGELEDYDNQANNNALQTGDRILSSYMMLNGEKLWIITESDRSVTTLLIPSEY